MMANLSVFPSFQVLCVVSSLPIVKKVYFSFSVPRWLCFELHLLLSQPKFCKFCIKWLAKNSLIWTEIIAILTIDLNSVHCQWQFATQQKIADKSRFTIKCVIWKKIQITDLDRPLCHLPQWFAKNVAQRSLIELRNRYKLFQCKSKKSANTRSKIVVV